MKLIRIILCALFSLTISLGPAGCGSDDDSLGNAIPAGLYGTWSGSKTISQTGSVRTVILTFRENRTGEFTYSDGGYYRVAEFSYTMNGTTVICDGTIVGEDLIANKFRQMFAYHASHISPIGDYSDFILTK